MIRLPGLGKKQAAVFALAAAAAVTGWSLYHRQAAIGSGHEQEASAPVKPVTMDDYRAAAAEADKAFAADDVPAVSAALSALEKVRVPREGMAAHQELVTALASYRDALAAGDEGAAAGALARLRSFAQENPWCGLSL